MHRFLFPRYTLALVVSLLVSLPVQAALPPGYTGKSVQVVFDGHGTWSQTGNYFSASADVTWHAVYVLPVPSLENTMTAEAGTTVTGNSSLHADPPGVPPNDCDGPLVVNTFHGVNRPSEPQTPLFGFNGRTNNVVHAWIDTYGGYDYRLCDGEYNTLVGDFPGNPDGYPTYVSRLGTAKFDIDLDEWTLQPAHTRQIPVSDSATVTGATASWTGTVTLSNESKDVQARVAGVDFGAQSGDAFAQGDPLPGTPVVVDHLIPDAEIAAGLGGTNSGQDSFGDALEHEEDVDLGDSCGVPPEDDWIDCGSQPDGTPEKVWPVLFVQGTPLQIRSATFAVSPGSLKGATVVGTATVNGTTLTLTSAPFDHDVPGPDWSRVSVTALTSDGALPAAVGAPTVQLSWRIERPGLPAIDAGTSRHPIYLLLSSPPPAIQAAPYLTIVDLTTIAAAAAGAQGQPGVLDAVWQQFRSREIHRRQLDSTTGAVTEIQGDAGLLKYYSPWTLPAFLENTYKYPARCPADGTLGLLAVGTSYCGEWATTFAYALALHGIDSRLTSPQNEDPTVWSETVPKGTEYMLVKPWTFVGKKKAKKGFPYLTKVRLKNTGGTYLSEPVFAPSGKFKPYAVQYPQSGDPPGQGSVRLPKGLFGASPTASDHAILFVPLDGRLYDPSYGSGPFATVAEWIPASLAGFARADGPACPPPFDKPAPKVGKAGVCRFRARPLSP
jgi:hypothetical protein